MLKKYPQYCFITGVQSDGHPLKPAGLRSAEEQDAVVARATGFTRTDSFMRIEWPTLQADGSAKNEMNKLRWWVKTVGR